MKNFSDYDFLFIPGYGNSVGQHWQAIWRREFPNAIWLEQADWDYPVKSEWVNQLHRAITQSKRPLIIIAHSLGCLTFVEWVAKMQSSDSELIKKIHAAFFVAVPDAEAETFPEAIRGFDEMKRCPMGVKSLVVASTNDPYARIERVAEFAASWGADLISIGDAGHINVSAGFGDWPEGKKMLNQLLS